MNTDSVAELTPSRAMLLQPDQAPEGTANQTAKARPPLDDHLHAKAKLEEPASAEVASECQGRDLNEVLNSSEPAPGDQVLNDAPTDRQGRVPAKHAKEQFEDQQARGQDSSKEITFADQASAVDADEKRKR